MEGAVAPTTATPRNTSRELDITAITVVITTMMSVCTAGHIDFTAIRCVCLPVHSQFTAVRCVCTAVHAVLLAEESGPIPASIDHLLISEHSSLAKSAYSRRFSSLL